MEIRIVPEYYLWIRNGLRPYGPLERWENVVGPAIQKSAAEASQQGSIEKPQFREIPLSQEHIDTMAQLTQHALSWTRETLGMDVSSRILDRGDDVTEPLGEEVVRDFVVNTVHVYDRDEWQKLLDHHKKDPNVRGFRSGKAIYICSANRNSLMKTFSHELGHIFESRAYVSQRDKEDPSHELNVFPLSYGVYIATSASFHYFSEMLTELTAVERLSDFARKGGEDFLIDKDPLSYHSAVIFLDMALSRMQEEDKREYRYRLYRMSYGFRWGVLRRFSATYGTEAMRLFAKLNISSFDDDQKLKELLTSFAIPEDEYSARLAAYEQGKPITILDDITIQRKASHV